VYEILQLPANGTLNRTLFYRSSTIIVSFIYQFTNSCDASSRRHLSQVDHDHFTHQLFELTSVLGDKHENHSHGGHEKHDAGDQKDHEDEEGHKHEHQHQHKRAVHDDDEHHNDEHNHDDHDDSEHHDDDENEEPRDEYFSQGQLEHLLRLIAVNYQPGTLAAPNSLQRKHLDLVCSFTNSKVCLLQPTSHG